MGFDSTGRALVGYGQVLSYHPVSTRVALAERRNGAWVDVWEKCSQGDVIPIAITLGVGADGKRAVFADTHARVGILPGGGMTARLPLRVGAAMARRLSMTGEVVDAAWAERIGLVTEVVVHDELLSRAIQLAEQIAEVPAPTMAGLKQMYVRGTAGVTDTALAVELEIARAHRPDTDALAARKAEVTARNKIQLQ